MPSLICLVLFAASLPDMLAERLAPMASNRTVKAEYRQEREFKGLSMKLVVRGTMAYERGKGLPRRRNGEILFSRKRAKIRKFGSLTKSRY